MTVARFRRSTARVCTRLRARAMHATLAGLAMATVTASTAGAQTGEGVRPVRHYIGVLGLNPLGIPFDIFAVEGEGVVSPGITVAGAVSYVAPSETRFTSGDVKVRYYPGEVALDGFSVGLGAGVTRLSDLDYRECTMTGTMFECQYPRATITAPTVSVLADYNFLLGQRRRFFVGTGVGAKRLVASREKRDIVDAPRAWVFAKFLVGLAY